MSVFIIGLKDDRSLLNSSVLPSLPLIMSAISISFLSSKAFRIPALHRLDGSQNVVRSPLTYFNQATNMVALTVIK